MDWPEKPAVWNRWGTCVRVGGDEPLRAAWAMMVTVWQATGCVSMGPAADERDNKRWIVGFMGGKIVALRGK